MLVLQCRLQQANVTTVGWIEQRGARLRARVELLGHDGLWQVTAVYQPPLDAERLREKQRVDRKGMPMI